MSKNNILSREGAKQLGKAMEQLKLSIEELLSISENMIPEKLLSTGFKEFFTTWCKQLEADHTISIKLNFTGEFQAIEDTNKIKIYLVFQSLISFLLNHAKPAQISFLFTCTEDSIAVYETDNGKKLNSPVLTYPGIREAEDIRTLTESMNGIFTILDGQKEGNEVKITILM